MDAIAGHPKAIRIAGRRMSQSGNHAPIKSPTAAKGPTPSSSLEDGTDDMSTRVPTDYPRPRGPSNEHEHEHEQHDDEEKDDRRRKKEDQRKKGMSSEESRMRKMESPSCSMSKGGQGRRMSGIMGTRISQPAGKMMG